MKKILITLFIFGIIGFMVQAVFAFDLVYMDETSVGKIATVKCENGVTFRVFQNTHLYKDNRFRYESGSGNIPYSCSSKVTPHWQFSSVTNQICSCIGSR